MSDNIKLCIFFEKIKEFCKNTIFLKLKNTFFIFKVLSKLASNIIYFISKITIFTSKISYVTLKFLFKILRELVIYGFDLSEIFNNSTILLFSPFKLLFTKSLKEIFILGYRFSKYILEKSLKITQISLIFPVKIFNELCIFGYDLSNIILSEYDNDIISDISKNNNKLLIIQEEMTNALILNCSKCYKPIVKEDGCNRIKCICGTISCWICKTNIDIEGYNHFCNICIGGKSSSNCIKCHLYDNNDNTRIINAIGDKYYDHEVMYDVNKLLLNII